MLRHGLQLGIAIVLARLISPEEFGTVALLALFLSVAGVLATGGFGTALIQRQDVTDVDKSTAFWINVGAGSILSLGLLLVGPAIASFYNQPVLQSLTAVMSVTVVIGAAGAVQIALLTKQLDFASLMKIGVSATLLSGTVAIFMAWRGYGVWALAAQSVVLTTTTTTLSWLSSRWRPGLRLSRASAGRLFGFGGYMLAANLLETVYTRAYSLLLGRFYGARELGYYVRADSTQQIPSTVLSNIVSRVALPLFSEAAEDTLRLRRGLRTAVRVLMLINVPMMLGTAAIADPLVVGLFGERWSPAIPILQVLCLAGVLLPLQVLNLDVLAAQGHARLMLRLELVKKLIGVIVLIAGASQGIMGIAWAYVVFSLVAFGVNAHFTHRFLRYGAIAQLRDVFPTFMIAVPMAGAVSMLAERWDVDPVVELLVLTASATAVFLAIASVVRLQGMRELAAAWGKRIEIDFPGERGDRSSESRA